MEELRRGYRNFLVGLAVISCALVIVLDETRVLPSWAVLKYIVNLSIIAIIFIYQKWLWRLLNPSLNFSGDWLAETAYLRRHTESGVVATDITSKHFAHISQDCLSISIAPSPGDHYANWWSLASNVPDRDTLLYCYEVHYSAVANFPPSARGIEVMKVISRVKTFSTWKIWQWGMPLVLAGDFSHGVGDLAPIYSGTAKFTRKMV